MVYDALVVVAILMGAGAAGLLFFDPQARALRDPAYTAYLLAVWFLYFGWCWSRGGQTLGMRAWKIRIRHGDGRRPGWGSSAVRFGVALVSASAAGLGFAWALFEPNKRTWHDMASRTTLISIRHPGRPPGRRPARSDGAAQDGDGRQGQQ